MCARTLVVAAALEVVLGGSDPVFISCHHCSADICELACTLVPELDLIEICR